MTDQELFTVVGMRPAAHPKSRGPSRRRHFPLASAIVLAVLVGGCLLAGVFVPKDPAYLDLDHFNTPPCREFWFGTDSLGRDIFSGIWYGGRSSLLIGFLSAAISAAIAVLYGAVSGTAPQWVDEIMMQFLEIFLSVPGLLLVLFFQAIFETTSVLSLAVVIGVTGWPAMAKVVRTEVRQLRTSGYVVASKCMGGSFFYILRRHYAPNFVASIMFMVVMNVRSGIVLESALSFMGMGLPLDVISWGSMLSLAEKALLTKSWWMILIPGSFLVALLLCLTELGNYMRKTMSRGESNL